MSYAEMILPEFDSEMANTRKVLERIPDDKIDWKPHPKMNSIGWNANHVAEIPGWVEGTLTQSSWDFSPPGGPAYKTPEYRTRREILDYFDGNVAAARRAIEAVDEGTLNDPWSLLFQGTTIFTSPRALVVRTFVLNHLIHHRAHLCVALRLNDVPVPGMYGPSGDDASG